MTTKLRAVSFQDNAVTTAKIAADAVTNAKIASTVNLGRRNLIINGAMQIFQRGSATFNHNATSTANLYGLDRFQFQSAALDELEGTITQVADAPVGFANSLKWTTTEPESAIAANELFDCSQKIEAQNLQQLAFGTSSAKKLTLSFYVKSSVTGTFAINIFKADSTARQLTSTYTISSANTWEQKTIIIPADTDSGGTIADDNGEGFRISWHIAAGSNFTSANNALTWTDYADGGWAYGHAQNGVATTDNATWQLTGVQLEVSDEATPFEHRSFGEELQLCKRYFQVLADGSRSQNEAICAGAYYTASILFHSVVLPVEMRSKPTMVTTNGTNYYITFSNGGGDHHDAIARSGNSSKSVVEITAETNVGGTSGHACFTRIGGTSSDAKCMLDAEL